MHYHVPNHLGEDVQVDFIILKMHEDVAAQMKGMLCIGMILVKCMMLKLFISQLLHLLFAQNNLSVYHMQWMNFHHFKVNNYFPPF